MQLGKIPWKRFDVRKLESEKSNLAPFGFTWGMVAKAKTHVLQHWRRNISPPDEWRAPIGRPYFCHILAPKSGHDWTMNFWCLRCSYSEIKMAFSKNGIVAKRYNWHCAQFCQLSRWKLQFPITHHATITVAWIRRYIFLSEKTHQKSHNILQTNFKATIQFTILPSQPSFSHNKKSLPSRGPGLSKWRDPIVSNDWRDGSRPGYPRNLSCRGS